MALHTDWRYWLRLNPRMESINIRHYRYQLAACYLLHKLTQHFRQPELAKEIQVLLGAQAVSLDQDWGLDHGNWTVLRHLYPEADIPIMQISLDRHKTPAEHFEFAKGFVFSAKD